MDNLIYLDRKYIVSDEIEKQFIIKACTEQNHYGRIFNIDDFLYIIEDYNFSAKELQNKYDIKKDRLFLSGKLYIYFKSFKKANDFIEEILNPILLAEKLEGRNVIEVGYVK